MGVLEQWAAVAEAEALVRSGGDTTGVDEEVLRRAQKNVAYATRLERSSQELERTLDARVSKAVDELVSRWSHFSPSDPSESVVLDGFESCPATEAVARFLADDSLRFLVLLGGVGCGKTVAAMTGAWAVQRTATMERGDYELRRAASDLTGLGFKPLDAWWDERVSSVVMTRRPHRQWSLWEARELPVLWDPWKAETEAGHVAGNRDRAYLILDDLGTERESDRFHEALGAFVDHRMLSQFKTVITTNLARPDIRARYGDRIADRINHVGKSFVVGGATRRKNGAGL